MTPSELFWPGREERSLLGRFYLSGTVGEGLAIVQPFQFAYLYLVMERPEWAVTPFLVSGAIVLLTEIPFGILSDRWSRKKAVILGYALSAASWALIPLAVSFEGSSQLLAVCACFVLDGLGETLVSGGEDAWVVDNLKSARRDDLIENFFARTASFESFGGIVAGAVALVILLTADASREVLDLLWFGTAAGQVVALAIAGTIPERRPPPADGKKGPGRGVALGSVLRAARASLRMRPLVFLALALIIASFADSIMDDAFVMSMVTRGLDARALAPLGIVEDFIGLVFPMLGVILARRMGAPPFLILFLVFPALIASVLFFQPGLWAVIAVCLLLDICEVVWDPVADAKLQALIPSEGRATLGSVVNQVNSIAELAGLAIFAMILGEHSELMRAATPDLVDAFAGGVVTIDRVPVGPLGLPIPDFAIVVFVIAGLAAIPFLALIRHAGRRGEASPP